MAKNLNVSLAFTANTNEAIAAIKKLQKELNGLATGSALKDSGISQITPEIQRAMVAAGELQAKLEAATNLKTGKLDLGQFSDSLKKGGVSLQQYANQLNALGPAGRQAFTNLASSIIQAEAPLIRCSQRVKELGTTLANTARWQISSSILHGFMGTVQSAYGYAQDLNKSLNDIRIVTGASVAEMDAFAAKANKAARALSTTTNEYAKASLIYFQQGDTQAQAMEKAAVTAKMANVTGQSADIVSNQLTAIWNNFNKEGDIAYEHYADVLTKLGAATASSTDEIAGGLEKFAGIADTIGLSYEYAASALATITATSRESEEVVGTALKTIFARIQGLKQGDTLEDGTTLNKYSEALQKVGISIFNQTGELKNMDNILEEMAAKWVTLSKDQQLALAQTVAGVRQYNQMVTLMDNWDFMEENLATASTADGELNKQAEIHAESWEAARDRVRAAAEELYTKLLDDDFFIGFLNGIEKVIDGVSGLVDAFGGLGGVLTTIGAYVTRIFQKEMAQGLRTAAQNIKGFINPKGVQAEQDAKKAEAIQALRNMKSFSGGQEGKAENAALSREASMQERLYQAAKNISEEEAKQLQIQMDSVRAMDKRAIAAAKNLDVAEKELKSLQDQNRLRTKMDAQVEARDRGRTKAGKALLEQAHKDVGQNTASFGESERQVVLAAEARAQQAVRSRHNFTADVSLDGYEDEIALELTRQLKGALADLDLKEGVDKKSVQGQLDKAIREAVVEATSGVDVKKTGKNVDTYQVQVQKAGNLNAQGIALSKLGAGGLTTQGADAKGLESIYTQLKVRIDAAQEAASQLKQEVKDSGNASNEIAQLNGVFEGLQTELEAAKGDAEALQKILDKLADESGAGELISRVAQNIGGEGGYIAQEANDGINQPSFDMSGQFESATNVGLKNIQSHNADVDVKNSQQNFDESSDKAGQGTKDWADGITNATNTIMDLGSAISSVQGAIDVFNDPDATGWDKVSAIISVIVGVLPVATGLFQMFGTTAATAGATAGAGMTAALGPIGAIILAVTALIAIFIALGSAVAANSPEGQLKSAQEATEKTAQAAQNAKNAYEDLLSTINKYDSAKDSLSELAKGTDEYTEALLKANEAARELIDTYGLTKIDVGEDGLIQLDEAELSEKKAEYRNQVEDTSSALTGAQKYENAKEDQVTRSNLYNDVMKKSTHYATTSEGYTYKDNYLINQDNMSKIMEAANTTEGGWDAYFAEGGKNIAETMGWDFENLDSYQQDFINALTNSSSALEEANAAILANAAANEAATKAQLVQNLSDEEAFQNSKYQDELVEAALNTQGKEQTEAQDKLSTMSENEKYNEYAKLMGYTNNGIGTWLDGKQEFLDKDGNKIELTQDQVTAQLEEMYAQEGMEQNAIDLIDTMNKVMARADENKEVISAAISGDVNKLTIGQRGMTGEEVAAMVTDEEAQAMGFESAVAFGESFASATENFAGEWQNLMGNYVDSVQNQMQTMLENGELDNLTLKQSENLANAFETAFASSGQAGMKTLQDMFLQTGEYSDEFANAIGTIDWETATPTTLQDALDAAGVATHFTTEQLNNLINAMNSANPSIEAATTKYASLHEIVDGLETGDTISEEQFKKFEEYGIAADDYFMRMADGTYKLIGDAEEFYNKVNGESIEGFKANIAAAQESNSKLENIDMSTVTQQASSHYDPSQGKNVISQDGKRQAQMQLDFLSETGYDDTEAGAAQLAQWTEDLAAGKLGVLELTTAVNSHIESLGGMEGAEEAVSEAIDQNNSEIEQSESVILSTAKSLTSLNKKAKENKTSTESYNKALKGLASQYESCHDEINDYNKAVEEHGENSEEAQKAAKALEKALENAEWKELTKGIKGYLDELKKLKDSDEIQKVYKEMAKSINNTFDTSVTEDFVSENIDLFKQWRNASGEEAQQLALQIKTLAIMASTDAQSFLTDNPIKLDVDGDGVAETITGVADKWAAMKSILEANPIQIDANGKADMSGLISALLAAGYTAEEVAGYIASIGETEVTLEGDAESLNYDLNNIEDFQAFIAAISGWDGSMKVTGGEVPAFGNVDMSQVGNSSGGGGGSKPKKAEPTKKSDIVERFKELEDQLDDVREESDRVKNSLDRLYGAEQEAAIQRLLELEQQEISLMKQKAEEAKKFMQEDLDELMKVSAEVDVEFEVDGKGNLVNYTKEMTELYEELTALETKAGDEWDEKEQEEIAALKEKISKLEEALAAYEETRELLEDINAELEEMAGTPPLPLIKSDYLDVYYEVEDKLDDIEEKIKDLEREAEGLTGEERLEVLRQIQELEEERLKTLEEQKEIARQDMEDKKAAMEEIAERNDLDFEYDGNGNITNYISEMEKLNKAYEELYDEVTEDELVTDDELAALDAMREDMEQMEEYAQGYRQAMETIEDIQNEIEDKGSGKSNDRFVRSDYIDIYRETNNQLDDIDEKIDDLERQADKLTGEERIAKLKEIQKLEKERLEVLKKQKDIAKADMEDRKAAMEELATLNGLLFDYDENGNITNYEEQMGKKIAEYEEEYTKALKDGVITETEQAILDAIDQDIQELEEAIDEYQDAVEQMEDIQNEMEEITESGYVDMDQLDDIGDKLHDINNTLDDIEDAINDASKAADRLYGEARIRQMNKTAQLIEKEIDALEKKKALQQEIIAEEKAELDEFSKGQVKYDSNGNISNYHEIIDSRKDAIRVEKDRLTNDEDGFTETDAEIVQEMIDELERMEEEIEEYEQAKEDLEDIENAIDDAYYEWQDLNAEQLSYKLELTLDVNDRELAKIERQISRLEGNFYTRAEALALMVGGGLGGSSKLGELNSQLSDLQGHYAEIKQWYAEGKISHEAYVSMTKEIQGEIENTAAEMEALQEQMDSYYKDTLAAARQELNFHISQIEHLTGVLGHYKNILTALGKSQDYEMMGTVLEGQVEALENEVQVAKRAMGMWQQEADEAYAKYQQALASGNQESADMYYQAYQEAINAANEAENKYYSKAQQWAQALKALMENTLAGLAQDLENALTGGTSFETINAQLKRASSLQEEYLTTTNKIYETTKMMRTAQNEIDKTTNSVAKKKLANFITETKQMQNQNKLSKYELSIQQAKYDLLLAEIALEEARFAKSTVRLQRDAEGNFGYIYTADAEAISNAEQKFEDASNKLYNLGLEGANKYTEKYQQTLSEMYDTLTTLQNKYLQGGFESEEEYNAAVTEAKEYYYEKLKQYSELYSVAINAESGTLTDTLVNNSRIVADAWSTDFADMTQKTEQWMNAVDGYLVEVRAAFTEWERESDRIANETVGTNLTDLKDKVGDIVTESETLTGTITNSVIPAIQSEINEVQRLTDAYANMAGSMQGAIDKAYALSDALQQDIDASVEQEMAKQDQETNTEENPTENEPTEENSTDSGGTIEPPPTENPDTDEKEEKEEEKTEPPHTHSYDDWKVTEKASCTKSGKKEKKCACGDIKTETIPKTDHKAGSEWKFDKEYHWHECTECGTKMDKAKHTIKDGQCTVCGYKPDSKENGIPEVGDTPTYVSGKYFYDSYGTDPAGSRGQGKKVKITQVIKNPKAGQDYPIHVESNDSAYGWLKASQLQGYDTGGYTGEWGPFGKLALLHEKELILNKVDTENFLASLELLDGILSTIDLYAMNSQFNSMMNSPYIPDLGKEALEQMVTIEASFPNATDKQEIEEAFKDLVNLASQYAHRK